MSKIKLFQTLDQSLFNLIDQAKSQPAIVQFQDQINALEAKQQKIVSAALSIGAIIFPIAITGILALFNMQERNTIATKREIINYASLIDKSSRDLNQISASSLSGNAIEDRGQLDNLLRNVLSQNQIDQSKAQVVDFNELKRSAMIVSTESKIQISRFANQDFAKFLRSLLEREKFKISAISLATDKETMLLSGTITLMHLGRNSNNTEEME